MFGAYDPGYSSDDVPGHMPRICAEITGACSKSPKLYINHREQPKHLGL